MKPYRGGVRHDYKDIVSATPTGRGRRWPWFVAGLFLPLAGVTLLLLAESEAPEVEPPPSTLLRIAAGASLPAMPSTMPRPITARAEPLAPAVSVQHAGHTLASAIGDSLSAPLDAAAAVLDLIVEKGDTLEQLFRRNRLSLNDLAAMVALPEAASYLKRLRPGDRIQVAHREGEVMTLRREIDALDLLSIERGDEGFAASKISLPVERRTNVAHGVIRSSLFEAGMDAGISDNVTMRMAGIFEWDIDFLQDVREGDRFTLLYEELWRDGVKIKDGDILAAEFLNQGKPYRAARYAIGDGRPDYYAPDGKSLRKAFIRAPVDFTRISSPFNPNRRHPILNTIRAHRGVDYAAPTGTPIRAAGDGKVLFRGVQGGYGNTIILQHGGNVTTLYGHLSKFASARAGSRVRQGEVIGYVGKSGLATGPHLHYEYRVNGVHRNPRTVPLPAADPVPADLQPQFAAVTATYWEQLDLAHRTHLASAAD